MSKKQNIDLYKIEKEISAVEKIICKISDKLENKMYDVIKNPEEYENSSFQLFEQSEWISRESERLRHLCYFIAKTINGEAIQ